MSVRFTQSCPTCGRRIEIRASLLGRTVACQHCQTEFEATADESFTQIDSAQLLMARVEHLLNTSTVVEPTDTASAT